MRNLHSCYSGLGYRKEKERLVRTGVLSSFFGARFLDIGKGAKVEHLYVRKALRPELSENALFGSGNLPVLEKSSAEKRSPPCANSTLFAHCSVLGNCHFCICRQYRQLGQRSLMLLHCCAFKLEVSCRILPTVAN